MRSGALSIERRGTDHYGRTLATVWAGRVNIACWQLQRRMAIYKPHWDDGRALASRCAAAR